MKNYNPKIHHRKSIRLKGFDYSQEGLYFITICCQDKIHRFGDVGIDPSGCPKMKLNEYGKIAHKEWIKLTERFPNFELDVFQIMPNHMHGIISLHDNPVGAGFTPAQNDPQRDINDGQPHINDGQPHINDGQPHINDGQPQGIAPTVSDIVGAYKSLVANGCLVLFKSKNKKMGKLWQRNYYEHIICNEKSYQTISQYIVNNPEKWEADIFYTE